MDQSTRHEGNEPGSESAQGVNYCASHPDVETGLSCNRCGRYMCTRCMVQMPVGICCRECVGAQRLPTFDVQPRYYLRASVVGGVVGVVTGLIWGGLAALFFFPALAGFASLAVGYAVGEAVSVATNRKRGAGLVAVTCAGMLVALLAAIIVERDIFRLLFYNYIGLLLLFFAIFTGVNRVR